jgi:hypothetical protein
VPYVPKKGKIVLLISALRNDDKRDLDTGDKYKLEVDTFYNSTKDEVDSADKMCAAYNFQLNIHWWPMIVCYFMLSIATVNTFVI